MKFEKSCGAVVFDQDKVLVVRHCAGHLDFPKGHMEAGETEEETAIREVKEETNIDIELTNRRYSIHYSPKPEVQKEVVFFVAKKVGGVIVPQEKEVSEARWISTKELFEELTFDSAKNLLQEILESNKNC